MSSLSNEDLSDSTDFVTLPIPFDQDQDQDQDQDFLLESIIEHPDRPESSRSPTPPTTTHFNTLHPQLDLSCVNSDETDASINSLFSFPDPLHSIDPIIRNTQSDQFHSDWFGPFIPSPTEFVSSDHHSNFSSDPLDFKSSPSPSLNGTDLQSHRSLPSPPNSPFVRCIAGSDLSHRLHVYICGHPTSEAHYHQISFHLRLNFTQIHSLNLDRPGGAPRFPRTRFRRAISRALSSSTCPTNSSIIPKCDLIHQTSWLEILLNDLTRLSHEDQLSFLSALPVQPTLLIFATSSPHPFLTKWLKELTLACSTQIHLFKVLPIVIDERKISWHSFFPPSFVQLFRRDSQSTAQVEYPVVDHEFLASESVFPGLLLQDSLDSMDHHILRPTELSLLSTSSVAKLHQLLIPFKPSVKSIERNDPPTSCFKYYAVIFGCLVTILASTFLLPFQPLGLQSLLAQPIMRMVGSTFNRVSTMGQVNVTLGLPLASLKNSSACHQIKIMPTAQVDNDSFNPAASKGSSVDTTPPATPGERLAEFNSTHPTYSSVGNIDSSSHHQVLHSNKAHVVNCKQGEVVALNQVADKGELSTRAQKDSKSHGSTVENCADDSADHVLSSESTSSLGSRSTPSLLRTSRCSSYSTKRNWNDMICILEDYYHRSNLESYFIHDTSPSSSPLFTHLNYGGLKVWSRRLPKRLKKSLHNLKHHPDLCIKKIRYKYFLN